MRVIRGWVKRVLYSIVVLFSLCFKPTDAQSSPAVEEIIDGVKPNIIDQETLLPNVLGNGQGVISRPMLGPLLSGDIADGFEAQNLDFNDTFNAVVFDDSFLDIVGVTNSSGPWTIDMNVVAEKNYPFAHEGTVWLESLNSIFFTSNRLGDLNSSDQYIEMWLLDVDTGRLTQLDENGIIPMPNGATRYGDDKVLVCSQGKNATGSSLYVLDPVTGDISLLIDNWFGLNFNSLNDVVVHPDGTILFTDPLYGFAQLFRNGSQDYGYGSYQLGTYVWSFKPGEQAKVIEDGLKAPNGLAFSPDFKTLYASDTFFFNGSAGFDAKEPHAIYAYDVQTDEKGTFLGISNKRMFYTSYIGIPDGIKVDNSGNVYTGVGSGVDVVSPDGILIGSFNLPKGVANLAFGGKNMDTLYMMNENQVVSVKLNTTAPLLPTNVGPTDSENMPMSQHGSNIRTSVTGVILLGILINM
jgi:gluconolactonase